MPLLLLDLDNTLIDRDAAFRAAVTDFLAGHALPAHDLAWLMSVDAGGYTPRAEVARAVHARYGERAPAPAVRSLLDRGAADRMVLSGPVRTALTRAATAGWTLVVVTNGRTAQQEAKIRVTGLDTLTHGWVVSVAVGHKKPAPEIFHAAAATVGATLDGAWVIGDSAHADIAGAVAAGVRSVWVSSGRAWPGTAPAPTRTAPDTATAIDSVVDAPE